MAEAASAGLSDIPENQYKLLLMNRLKIDSGVSPKCQRLPWKVATGRDCPPEGLHSLWAHNPSSAQRTHHPFRSGPSQQSRRTFLFGFAQKLLKEANPSGAIG